MQPQTKIPLDHDKISAFCRKWKITKLELFGSVLREDFNDDSDVDFMYTFADDARWTLFDLVGINDN